MVHVGIFHVCPATCFANLVTLTGPEMICGDATTLKSSQPETKRVEELFDDAQLTHFLKYIKITNLI